jgi:hypothetical protein
MGLFVMRKVIQKYLFEVEMKQLHKAAVQKRHRDFGTSGRTLKFGYSDLEQDERELEGKSDDQKPEGSDLEVKPEAWATFYESVYLCDYFEIWER